MAKLNFQKPLLFGVTSDMVLQKSFLYADFVLKKHFLLLSVLKKTVLWKQWFISGYFDVKKVKDNSIFYNSNLS